MNFLRFDISSTKTNRSRKQTKFAPIRVVYIGVAGAEADLSSYPKQICHLMRRTCISIPCISISAFHGRFQEKQYMPSDPVKNGLKFWCLYDAATGTVGACSRVWRVTTVQVEPQNLGLGDIGAPI